MAENINQYEILTIEVPITISTKHNMPCVEMRRNITCNGESINNEIIRAIISAAYHNKAIIIQPKFNSKIHAIASLIEKGILYKEGEGLFFTF